MATPARRTSKTKKRSRRNHQKLSTPAVHWDPQINEYVLSHHISPSGLYHGHQVIKPKYWGGPPINYSDQLVLTSFNHLFNRYGLPHAILRYDGSSQAVEITFGDQRAILLFVSLLGYLQADFRTRLSHNGQVVDIDTQNFNVDQVTFIINSVDQNAMDAFINGTN